MQFRERCIFHIFYSKKMRFGPMGPGPMGAWAHGPWAMGHGPWAMGHGPWAHGPKAHGPWAQGPKAHGPWDPKPLIFLRKTRVFYMPAPYRSADGKDNSTPAEDLHNKNPSLALSGKTKKKSYGHSAETVLGCRDTRPRLHCWVCLK